ncbi:MAG: SulP family inorganic anion transporter [Leptolyngbyaceae cyanobacterium]
MATVPWLDSHEFDSREFDSREFGSREFGSRHFRFCCSLKPDKIPFYLMFSIKSLSLSPARSQLFPGANLAKTPYIQKLSEDLQPDRLTPSFVAGMITGLIGVIRAISYAALIFSGALASDLNVGVGIAVLSSALISIVVALTSSLSGMIATPLAAPTVVLTILAAGIVERVAPNNPYAVLPTVIAAIAIGSILTGSVLWLLGQFRWGKAMEFLPYPVVGGFMAGTGLLLVRGAFKVMTEQDLMFSNLLWFSQGEVWPKWLAGLAIAAVLLWATHQFHHYLVMPTILLLSTGVFYGSVWGFHLPMAAVRQQGWLLGPFPAGNLWQPLTIDSLHQVEWIAILHSGNILALLVFVSLVSLVLTNGSLELAIEKDLDLNRELKAVGLANLVAGFGSTMVGNQALPSTLLVHKMGGASRFTGIFKTIPCFTVLILGPTFLGYFPKPILGSVLLFLGLGLLWQWLYSAWFRLQLADYLVIWVTLVVINVSGFLPGIAVGFGLAALQFLYDCSRLNPTADKLSEQSDRPTTNHLGSPNLESNSALAPAMSVPATVDVVDLQGYLFFGTAKDLCQQLCDRILHPAAPNQPLQYLVLDFQNVLALDASAAISFSKVAKLAQKHDCRVLFCQISDGFNHRLCKAEAIESDPTSTHVFANQQAALAWCHAQPQPSA